MINILPKTGLCKINPPNSTYAAEHIDILHCQTILIPEDMVTQEVFVVGENVYTLRHSCKNKPPPMSNIDNASEVIQQYT